MDMQPKNKSSFSKRITPKSAALAFLTLSGLILVSIFLTMINSRSISFTGWTSFLAVGLLGLGVILGAWRLLRSEKPPSWLFTLVLAAVLIRLAAGLLWFTTLPVYGHGTPAEVGGYVMGDAAGRDQAAWKLAASGESLLRAFQNNRKVDQYGGLLFISAAIYRFVGSEQHQALLIVLLAACGSALAVLFGWAFTRRIWGEQTAAIAAWGLVLYPEGILLGSSQMREAFTIPLVAAAFYGLARFRDERTLAALTWVFVPFLITVFLSPLTAGLLLGGMVLFSTVLVQSHSGGLLRNHWFWLAIAALVVVGLAGLWLELREVVPERITNPIAMASWWLRKSASFQAYISQHASGWMQKIFKFTPEWLHLPMLLTYGIVQPFFPAALIAGSEAPIWRAIAIWRSVGWTLLLAFLAFAPFHAWRKDGDRSLARMLTLIVWLFILIAAFRGGSDAWDNPRYRTIFVILQTAIAARIIIEERQSHDPWLKRAMLIAGAILLWFLPWYVDRYYTIGWPITDPIRTLMLGFACGILLVIGDWAVSKGKNKNTREHPREDETNPPGEEEKELPR